MCQCSRFCYHAVSHSCNRRELDAVGNAVASFWSVFLTVGKLITQHIMLRSLGMGILEFSVCRVHHTLASLFGNKPSCLRSGHKHYRRVSAYSNTHNADGACGKNCTPVAPPFLCVCGFKKAVTWRILVYRGKSRLLVAACCNF